MENNNYVLTEEKISVVEEQQMSLWTEKKINMSEQKQSKQLYLIQQI
jgi:hypothetical protein